MSEESLFNKELQKELTDFLEKPELKSIFEEYETASKECNSTGFNIFTIISNYYFRENFHGDILYSFLNPKGEHGEGDKFLKIFIDMLGVDTNDYGLSTTVEREVSLTGEDKGRIDFVIKNENNHQCIIVENKLYDAVDMPNQLSRYFDEMNNRQMYEVDRIAYLPLSVGKRPEGIGKKVDALLKVVPAVNVSDSKCSLINNWIDPCIEAASSLDCISILRQYKRLLISLKPEMTKYKSSMDLYEYIKKDNNFEKVLLVKNMLNNLGKHLAIRLTERLMEKNLESYSADCCESGRKICLNNGYCLWIYCVDDDNMDYIIKIHDCQNVYIDPRTLDWLPDDLKRELCVENNIANQPFIHFKLIEEDKLIETVKVIVEAANKKTNITKNK